MNEKDDFCEDCPLLINEITCRAEMDPEDPGCPRHEEYKEFAAERDELEAGDVDDDHYTALPGASDTARYKALGNSMAVPCMAWIGRRIARVDAKKNRAVHGGNRDGSKRGGN